MSKIVYCSNCGVPVTIIRKAMPKFGRIIDLIEPHVCLDEPIQPDLTANPAPAYVQEAKGKFVQILNELQPGPGVWPQGGVPEGSTGAPGMMGTGDLRDRRSNEFTKSSAPRSILSGLGQMENTSPAHNLVEPGMSQTATDEEVED